MDHGMELQGKLPRAGTTIFSVMSKLAAEHGAINLGQGFPDFPIDPVLGELVAAAIRKGHNQYAPMPGILPLREAIAAKAERLYGHAYDPGDEVTITAGATQAIFTVFAAVVRPGDEVVLIDPSYDSYAPGVELFGGTPVHVQLGADMAFDAEAVRRAITPRTKLLLINTPHNPAGRILRDADMCALAELLRGTDILLLSDEVYEHIVFDGVAHASAMRHPELRRRSFITFSFGKTFHVTGWKVGYVLAPRPMTAEFRKAHQFNVFSVNTPVQHALAEYLREPGHYQALAGFFQAKRDRLVAGLRRSRMRPLPCEGSYFLLADYRAVSDLPDLEFAQWMTREHGVATIPLSPFYRHPPPGQRLVRFCFAKQDATLDAATEKLCKI